MSIDVNGNTDSCSFKLTVVDTTNPTGTCPNTITQATQHISCQDIVPNFITNYNPTDNCGISSITQNPAFEDTVSIGTHTITLTTTDNSGNTHACTTQFILTNDVTPDITTCGTDKTIAADAQCKGSVPTVLTGLVVSSCATSTNTQSPAVGDLVPFGDNIVTIMATDPVSTHNDTCTVVVHVIDTTAPSVTNCINSIVIPVGNTCSATFPNITINNTGENFYLKIFITFL